MNPPPPNFFQNTTTISNASHHHSTGKANKNELVFLDDAIPAIREFECRQMRGYERE